MDAAWRTLLWCFMQIQLPALAVDQGSPITRAAKRRTYSLHRRETLRKLSYHGDAPGHEFVAKQRFAEVGTGHRWRKKQCGETRASKAQQRHVRQEVTALLQQYNRVLSSQKRFALALTHHLFGFRQQAQDFLQDFPRGCCRPPWPEDTSTRRRWCRSNWSTLPIAACVSQNMQRQR